MKPTLKELTRLLNNEGITEFEYDEENNRIIESTDEEDGYEILEGDGGWIVRVIGTNFVGQDVFSVDGILDFFA